MLVLNQAHRGSSAVVLLTRLDPLVTHLGVSDVISGLLPDLAVVVDVVAQTVRVVSLVDGLSARQVLLMERGLGRGEGHQGLLPICVVKVRLLEELDAVGAQTVILTSSWLHERALVFWLSVEAAVARLEVRASDVARRQFVQACVHPLTG